MDNLIRNTDPSRRLVCLCEVSQESSTSSHAGYFYPTLKEMDESFKDSNAIRSFYSDPLSVGKCLVICLYDLKGSNEVRRRMMITETPDSFEDVKKLFSILCESVGVTVNFHDVKVTSGFASLSKQIKTVKENDVFLYNLIEYYENDVIKPLDQLSRVRETLLHKSVVDNDSESVVVGSFIQEYLESRSNYYKIASKFGDHLSQADLKLSTRLLPDFHCSLLEFPFCFKFSDFYIRNAFVSVVTLSNCETKGITVVCPKYVDGKWDGTLFHTTIDVTSSDSIESSLKETAKFFYNKEMVQLGDIKVYKDLVSFCIKCLIYISSSEPDLHPEKGEQTNKKTLTKIKKFHRNHCPFDLIKVGYAFHGRHYSINETGVRGHFRWQPCGEGMKEIKLIWIDEHVRHFTSFSETKEIN